LVYDRPIVGTF